MSELSSDGAISTSDFSIPALKVRRAETTLELPSGGTLAMAGLLSDETRQSVEGVPGLKDVAILGALFRSNDYRRRESELVILVTPYMANARAAQRVCPARWRLCPLQHAARSCCSGTSIASTGLPATARTGATKAMSGSSSTIQTAE